MKVLFKNLILLFGIAIMSTSFADTTVEFMFINTHADEALKTEGPDSLPSSLKPTGDPLSVSEASAALRSGLTKVTYKYTDTRKNVQMCKYQIYTSPGGHLFVISKNAISSTNDPNYSYACTAISDNTAKAVLLII
jgi:hypothetical protein